MRRKVIAVAWLLTTCGFLAGCCLPAPNDRQGAGNASKIERPVSPTAGPEPKYLDGLGVYECVYIFMKNEYLHDPSSLQIVESHRATLEKLEGSDVWVSEIRYRARNQFGALVLDERLALMMNGRCLMLITKAEWVDVKSLSDAKRIQRSRDESTQAPSEVTPPPSSPPVVTVEPDSPTSAPTPPPEPSPEPKPVPAPAPSPVPSNTNRPRPPPS